MKRLSDVIAQVPSMDEASAAQARARQDQLTKPQRSLGMLEDLSIQLAGITGKMVPTLTHKLIVIMAADHGVSAEGVSAYPAEVTAQMVAGFLAGGAAINVLAKQAGARLAIVDAGVAADLPPHPQLLSRKIARGTANMATGPAMTREQALTAILSGVDILEAEVKQGLDVVGTGEMGIGNTTASAAILAAITGAPLEQVVGRGTGLNDAGLAHKREVIRRALELTTPAAHDPLDVLAKVGGFEIAGLVGVILAGAAHRLPVVIDGFISGAAALLAVELCPAVRPYLIAAHLSQENGHRLLLTHLGLHPLLDLRLRLGEGTGAALAFPLLDAAVAILRDMATFTQAGVSRELE